MTVNEKTPATTARLVVVEYNDLIQAKGHNGGESSSDLRKDIAKAFGSNGNGIIGIRNVPGFVEAKRDLLSLAHSLAHLPAEELKELEDPETLYNSGWSHGKEKLRNDAPDWNKASFYFNPLTDVPGTSADREAFPLSYPCNRWPRTESLPTFEGAAKRLGSLMKDVAVEMAGRIDDYAQSVNESYTPRTLHDALVNTEKAKGRLLYYYPLAAAAKDDRKDEEDSWIGWHNDSGFLTCLSGGVYMEPDGRILPKCPCEEAGLYIVDRNDRVLRVEVPGDCMAIQIGECTQILTGGAVIATPHCVRGAPGVARTTLACFIDTPPTHRLTAPPLPPSTSPSDPNAADARNLLAKSSSRVPPLAARWKDGMMFGEFLDKTFKMYYDFDPNSSTSSNDNGDSN